MTRRRAPNSQTPLLGTDTEGWTKNNPKASPGINMYTVYTILKFMVDFFLMIIEFTTFVKLDPKFEIARYGLKMNFSRICCGSGGVTVTAADLIDSKKSFMW